MADTFGFSLTDAKRIGRAVRLVERDEPRQDLSGEKDATVSRGVRLLLAKHEGTAGWPKETTATVTVYNGDPLESAITVAATNQFVTFPTSDDCTHHWVALGNNGWGWYAVSRERACPDDCTMDWAGVDFAAIPQFDDTKTQLLGHELGCLKWIDTIECITAAGG